MKLKNKKLIISCDFDQTIAKVPHFPRIDGLRKGAKKYINKLYDEGHYIIINTCRTDNYENECYDATNAVCYLLDCGIRYHHMNNNHPQLMEYFQSNSRKISCDIGIDDRNLSLFGLPPWWLIYYMIKFKNIFMKKRLLDLIK